MANVEIINRGRWPLNVQLITGETVWLACRDHALAEKLAPILAEWLEQHQRDCTPSYE